MPSPVKRPKQMTPTQIAQHNLLMNRYQTAATTSTVTTIPTSNMVWINTTNSTGTLANNIMNSLYASQTPVQGVWPGDSLLVRDTLRLLGECEIADGEPCKVKLPDGGLLEVDADGSYRINDKDAKVTYRATRVRDFNPFLNASDKLEDFIKFCGTVGVRQGDMLGIPIRHFVQWLVIEAAKADGEQPPAPLALPDLRKPRCATCGRFISKEFKTNKMEFCRPSCFETKYRQFHKENYNEIPSNHSVVGVIERHGSGAVPR